MMETTISEKTRKYLISILYNEKEVFAIWGTDMIDNESDKLLINRNQLIVVFERPDDIAPFILKNNDLLFDRPNFLDWIKKPLSEKPYARYDLDSLAKFVNDSSRGFITCDIALNFLHFLNLFLDYAYQLEDKKLNNFLSDGSIALFKDCIYSRFVWKTPAEEISKLDDTMRQLFWKESFRNRMLKTIALFASKLSLSSPSYER